MPPGRWPKSLPSFEYGILDPIGSQFPFAKAFGGILGPMKREAMRHSSLFGAMQRWWSATWLRPVGHIQLRIGYTHIGKFRSS
jgi:hypothetical protein